MENNPCHNDVTCPLWGDPELTQALEPGFEYAYGHLNPGSSPAVGRIKTLLGAQQSGQAWIASIYQQVAIKLSCNYRGHI